MIRTKQWQLVELQVNTNLGAGQRLYFQDQAQLRSQQGQNVFIAAMCVFVASTVPNSFLSSLVVGTIAENQNAALVLNVSGREREQLIPLVELINLEAPGTFEPFNRDLFLFDDLYNVDWTKSYVQVAAATTTAPFAFLFGVWYDWYPYFHRVPVPMSMPENSSVPNWQPQ
jgi:hypothetical protein